MPTGLTFLPQTLTIVVGAQISSRLMPRIGARPFLVGGPLLISLGLLWMAQVAVGPAIWSSVLLPGALVTLGAGLAFPAITVAATAGVPRSESGLASGVVNTSRQVGGSLGLAALATLAADHAAALSQTGHAVPVALTGGFGLGFAGGAAIALAAGLSGLLVPGRTRRAEPQRRVTQSGAEEAAA